jgi:tRNA G37 N-methylase TrmD
MRFDIVTIFPRFFAGVFEHGIVRRAQAKGLVTIEAHDLRAFTHDKHRTVDDRPFGGGEGMILKPEPMAEALASLGITPKIFSPTLAQDARKDGATGEIAAGATADPSTPAAATAASAQDDSGDFGGQDDSGDFGGQDDSRDIESFAFPGLKIETWGTRADGETSSPAFAQSTRKDGATEEVAAGTTAGPSTPAADTAAFAQDDSGRFCDRDDKEKVVGAGGTRVILLSAQGRPFSQAVARELACLDRVVLLCGRYEGVDERIRELFCDMELSIGDYVLSGGELAAAVVIDAVMRLVPGVLGNEASAEFESFGVPDAEIDPGIGAERERVPRSQHGAGGLLDYPHYTRPAEFNGLRVPEVLLNGDHRQIRRWRREQQLRKTLFNRPDLLEHAELSAEDRELLRTMRVQRRGEG